MTPSAPAASAARSHRGDLIPGPGAVTRISDNGQMRLRMNRWHGRQIKHIPCRRVEGSHATLAQNHLAVALGEDVFGRQEQVADRGREPPLEEHRHVQLADALEQRIVLHVPRANLNAVGVLGDEMCAFFIHRLGHDREPRLLLGLSQQFESAFAESLKRIR